LSPFPLQTYNWAMAGISVITLGCKLNQAEGEELCRRLEQAGYVPDGETARAYIVNTCTVTRVADAKARHLLRRLRREHPQALVVATGCYAQRAPGELSELAHLVVPQQEKEKLPELLAGMVTPLESNPLHPHRRTRALVKVQDGCNLRCSYCVVPAVRGRERSLPPEAILHEVRARHEEGYREVVLTGTRLGAYRWNGTSLAGLLALVLGKTAIERVRLSSLQPQEIGPGLLPILGDPRICPHLHLPLQSGSDRVLEAMGRPTTSANFTSTVEALRREVAGLAITTDIMVGFPTEGEREFEESLSLCRELGFARLHVFPYSPRPGTKAAALPPVLEKARRARIQRMLLLAEECFTAFRRRFLGEEMPVLWEEEGQKGIWTGLTLNYLRIFAPSQEPLTNQVRRTRLVGLHPRGLWGELE
jgi:threonylcarbamoyladenosine tRNA methylthiotransferase MtaB